MCARGLIDVESVDKLFFIFLSKKWSALFFNAQGKAAFSRDFCAFDDLPLRCVPGKNW
jgi:hypothetical protein